MAVLLYFGFEINTVFEEKIKIRLYVNWAAHTWTEFVYTTYRMRAGRHYSVCQEKIGSSSGE